jgi:hypothetical protein
MFAFMSDMASVFHCYAKAQHDVNLFMHQKDIFASRFKFLISNHFSNIWSRASYIILKNLERFISKNENNDI